MANMNIVTPRFYSCLASYHYARGHSIASITATDSGTYFVGLPATNTVEDLFDLRPLNTVTFDTSSDTDGHVLTQIEFQDASYKQNFIAILNHNLNSSDGRFKVVAGNHTSDNASLDGGGAETSDINWGSVTVSEVVNADTIAASDSNKTVTVTPASDGTTIITFTEQDLQYWGIQFEGDTTWNASTDFTCGGIMIGTYYDMPFAPDMAVKRSIIYDKTKIQESLGGQRFASTTSFGRSSGSPFGLGSGHSNHGGRISYDMKFSYLNNTDVMPDEYSIVDYDDNTFIGRVWNMVDGNNRPFIFSIDNSSTGANAESEHIFARFDQESLEMSQSAHNVFNVGLTLSEEF
tara:strand:+ start:11936 stop:12979 length:1044 start_codon:yes stop_codon:yes gene_type:complete